MYNYLVDILGLNIVCGSYVSNSTCFLKQVSILVLISQCMMSSYQNNLVVCGGYAYQHVFMYSCLHWTYYSTYSVISKTPRLSSELMCRYLWRSNSTVLSFVPPLRGSSPLLPQARWPSSSQATQSIILSTRPVSHLSLCYTQNTGCNEIISNRQIHLVTLKVINIFGGRWLTP